MIQQLKKPSIKIKNHNSNVNININKQNEYLQYTIQACPSESQAYFLQIINEKLYSMAV